MHLRRRDVYNRMGNDVDVTLYVPLGEGKGGETEENAVRWWCVRCEQCER